MRFSENLATVTLIESKDYGSAGITSDAVHLAKLNGFSALLTFGALTGNSTLIAYASAARDLTTTAVAFSYRLAGAIYKAASADVFGDAIAVPATGLVLTAAAFQHRQMVIEFDSDSFTDGKPWLTLNIDNAATTLNVAALGIGRPRHAGHPMLSVL